MLSFNQGILLSVQSIYLSHTTKGQQRWMEASRVIQRCSQWERLHVCRSQCCPHDLRTLQRSLDSNLACLLFFTNVPAGAKDGLSYTWGSPAVCILAHYTSSSWCIDITLKFWIWSVSVSWDWIIISYISQTFTHANDTDNEQARWWWVVPAESL